MAVKFRGVWTCACVAKSLPLVEADMKRKGIIKYNIDIFQGGYNKGGVSASAGTHDGGGCTDVGQYSDAGLKVWREWGWTQQHRTPAQGFKHHGHGHPKGCTHLSSGARYQASEWNAGRNGLRSRGPITGPGPKGKSTPTWQQAIKNHHPAAKPKPKPAPKKPTPQPQPSRKGVFGMSTPIYNRYNPNQKIKGTSDVWINDKHFVSVTGETRSCTVSGVLRLAGLVEGEWAEVTWRLAEVVKKNGKDVTTVRHERVPVTVLGVTGRKQNESITFNGGVPKNQRLRVIVKTNAANLVVEQLEVQGWKE